MRKLAVVMFTDIEGFTAALQKDEHWGKHLYDTHRAAVSEKIPISGGKLIQFFGDGSLSTFSSALQAIQCAIKLQLQFRGSPSIPVRIGIHLGEIVLSEENAFGDPVNVASRIESMALSGSILISDKVFQEVANKPEIATVFIGSFHFKNLRRPMRIYAIDDPNLVVPRQAHHNAKFVDNSFKSNMPQFNDEFIGRKKLREDLAVTVKSNRNSIISVIGAGGIGKTRLATQVALDIRDSFQQGICFVSLDSQQSSATVPLEIGSKLGLKEHAESNWIERIHDHLMDQELLLVLDNLEHLLDCGSFLEQLNRDCPLLTILCTTRKSLELGSEIEFQVDAMQVPSALSQERNLSNECIRLFENKAQRVKSNFSITANNYQDVAEICCNLEGVPLAIELAAARIKMLSPRDIKNQFSSLFKILRSSKLPLPRHQTIYKTIKWSYDLLTNDEREVLCCLAVIPGNISIELVELLNPNIEAFKMIEQLFNHSLIYRATDTHNLHYRMLNVVREFGKTVLQDKHELEKEQDAFAKVFIDQLKGLLEEEYLHQDRHRGLLEDSFDNLRFVTDYWSNKNPKIGADLLLQTWKYYLDRGFIREAYDKVRLFLNNMGKLTLDKAHLQVAYGTLSQNLGKYSQSREVFDSALRYFIKRQSVEPTIAALNHLSWAEFRLGNYEKATSYAEHALDKAKVLDSTKHICRSLNNLAWVHHFRGHTRKAHEIHLRVFTMYESLQDKLGMAFSLTNKTWTAIDIGQTEDVFKELEYAIKIFEDLKNQQLFAFAHLILAIAHTEMKNFQDAKDLINLICLPIFTSIGDSWGIAMAMQKLSETCLATGNYREANEMIGKALEIRRRNHDRWGMAAGHTILVQYHIETEDSFEARRHVEIAIVKAEEMNCRHLLTKLHSVKARIYWQDNRPQEAAIEIELARDKIQELKQQQKFDHDLRDIYLGLKRLKFPLQKLL